MIWGSGPKICGLLYCVFLFNLNVTIFFWLKTQCIWTIEGNEWWIDSFTDDRHPQNCQGRVTLTLTQFPEYCGNKRTTSESILADTEWGLDTPWTGHLSITGTTCRDNTHTHLQYVHTYTLDGGTRPESLERRCNQSYWKAQCTGFETRTLRLQYHCAASCRNNYTKIEKKATIISDQLQADTQCLRLQIWIRAGHLEPWTFHKKILTINS